jgi:hypothetical protein
MSEQRYSGACLCGRVQFEALGPATNLCYCYCRSCRRASGAPLVAWGTFARSGFRITRGTLTEHRSSPPVVRGLCAACGGALTYRHQARPEEIDVTLASLDAAAALAPQLHVWVSDKLPWVRIDDGLPQFAGDRAEPATP